MCQNTIIYFKYTQEFGQAQFVVWGLGGLFALNCRCTHTMPHHKVHLQVPFLSIAVCHEAWHLTVTTKSQKGPRALCPVLLTGSRPKAKILIAHFQIKIPACPFAPISASCSKKTRYISPGTAQSVACSQIMTATWEPFYITTQIGCYLCHIDGLSL